MGEAQRRWRDRKPHQDTEVRARAAELAAIVAETAQVSLGFSAPLLASGALAQDPTAHASLEQSLQRIQGVTAWPAGRQRPHKRTIK